MKTLKFVSILVILISALFLKALSQVKSPIGTTGPIKKVPAPQSLPVTQIYDIQIADASTNLSSICPGGTIQVNYTLKFVTNNNSSSTPRFGTKFYLSTDATWSNSDAYLGEQFVSSISANTSRSQSLRVFIPNRSSYGNQYILVKADANNQVKEISENNNEKPIGPIAIGSNTDWVDLQVTSASVSPASVIAGALVHISYKIQNVNDGSCGIAGVSKTKFYIADDLGLSSSNVYLIDHDETKINPGAINSAIVGVTIPLSTSIGNKYLLVICDADNQLIEKIETNNIKATNQISVKPLTGTVADIDGNTYKTVTIGNQWWMAENLKVTHYRNGDAIPNITDDTAWSSLTTGACCNYWNDATQAATYGKLYNGFAISDSRNLAPAGWHVPSDAEWQILQDYLGGYAVAGGKMKEIGTSHWNTPNTGATNTSGFSALPGSKRYYVGMFADSDYIAYFWSSSEVSSSRAWFRELEYNSSCVYRGSDDKREGYSIRCVKD